MWRRWLNTHNILQTKCIHFLFRKVFAEEKIACDDTHCAQWALFTVHIAKQHHQQREIKSSYATTMWLIFQENSILIAWERFLSLHHSKMICIKAAQRVIYLCRKLNFIRTKVQSRLMNRCSFFVAIFFWLHIRCRWYAYLEHVKQHLEIFILNGPLLLLLLRCMQIFIRTFICKFCLICCRIFRWSRI